MARTTVSRPTPRRQAGDSHERLTWSDTDVVKITMTALMYATGARSQAPRLAAWFRALEAFARDSSSAQARARLKRETDALGFVKVA